MPVQLDPQSTDQRNGYETVDRIRRSHLHAKPKPSENPAWANCHMDCGILLTEVERLRAAIFQACSDMGCYCADDDPLPENLKCPMCKLEKALHGSAADVPHE